MYQVAVSVRSIYSALLQEHSLLYFPMLALVVVSSKHRQHQSVQASCVEYTYWCSNQFKDLYQVVLYMDNSDQELHIAYHYSIP